ncbi:MAG: SIMPL domain-containing protein [Actinomycetota bacterium]|nr:SIMPL domain-containing protein [Actinomycetota bacterium]
MSTTVTISLRSLVATATIVTMAAAAYTVGSARADSARPQPVATVVPTAGPEQDGIFVRGSGAATGVPDRLRFSFGSHATASDVSAALARAGAATRRVLSALRAHDVARRDVQTTGLSLHPVFDHGGDGPPQITGYAASQRFSVLVRELPRAGEALAAAVEAGGNAVRLSGVRLEVDDPQALLRQARARAFAEARAKARQYAHAAGRRLGELVSVHEGVSARPPAQRGLGVGLEALARDLQAVPVRPGQEEVTVDVSLVWALA